MPAIKLSNRDKDNIVKALDFFREKMRNLIKDSRNFEAIKDIQDIEMELSRLIVLFNHQLNEVTIEEKLIR